MRETLKHRIYAILITLAIWALAFTWAWLKNGGDGGLKFIRPITQEQEWRKLLYEEILTQDGDWYDYRVLRQIAQFESDWRQFDENGNVLEGYAGDDWGIFQIRGIHRAWAAEKGLDIDKPEDNIKTAVAIWVDQGTVPWNASKSKWRSALR